MTMTSLLLLALLTPEAQDPALDSAVPAAVLAEEGTLTLGSTTHLSTASQTNDEWRFALVPYVWIAGLDGDVGIGPVVVDADVGFDDLLDHADFGAMVGFEAQPTDAGWKLVFDSLFMDLGDDLPNADVDVSLLMTEIDIAFQPESWEQVELLVGARYWDIESELRLGPLNPKLDEDWLDPIIGVRGVNPVSDALSLNWRADIGGFGAGSDLSYQLSATLTGSLGASTRFGFGWRHLAVEYDEESFLFDTVISGPTLGISWSF